MTPSTAMTSRRSVAVELLHRLHRPGAHLPLQPAHAHGIGRHPRDVGRGLAGVIQLAHAPVDPHAVLAGIERERLRDEPAGIDERQQHATAPVVVAGGGAGEQHGAQARRGDFHDANRRSGAGRAPRGLIGEHAHHRHRVDRRRVHAHLRLHDPGGVEPDHPSQAGVVRHDAAHGGGPSARADPGPGRR